MPAYTAAALLAMLFLAVAFYVQLRLAAFTDSRSKLLVTRAVLIAVGLGVGWVGAAMYADAPASLFAFLVGFGIVHLPASLILFMKGQRGEGPS